MRKAIILAAGMGTRLKPLTEKEHKCMTKVNGIPIIYNTLSILQDNDFDEIIIVVGYLCNSLKKQINDFGFHLNIKYVENVEYRETNTIFSLQMALHQLDSVDELVVIEGDVFFEKSVFERLINSNAENTTILEAYNESLDGSYVEINEKNYVVDWRHKSDQEEGYNLKDKYKTVNLHKLNGKFVREQFIKYIDDYVDEYGKNIPLEKIFRKLVQEDNKLIYGEVLGKEKWYEIDDIKDLEMAEQIFR